MALTKVQKWSGGPLEGTRGPPGSLERVGSPSQSAGSGQEALRQCWEMLGGPPEESGGVAMPYWRVGRSRKALPVSWDGSGGVGEVGRDGRGWEALLEGWEESGGPLGEPRMGGVGSPLRRAERIRRPS